MKKFFLTFLSLCLVFFSSAHSATCQQTTTEWARVEKIIDGDTLWVAVGESLNLRKIKVRLIGIDSLEFYDGEKTQKDLRRLHTTAAEMKAGSLDAKAFLSTKLPKGSKVKLVDDKKIFDPYGRRLSYLYTEDGEFLNKTLIAQGLAGLLVYAPNESKAWELKETLLQAKRNKVGLWGKGYTLTERWKK